MDLNDRGWHAFFGRRNDMKVVAAIDSMKGSIGSIEAGTAAKAGIRRYAGRMLS